MDRPQALPLTISMGEAINGTGWYAPERHGSISFRWSGPECVASVDFSVSAASIEIIRFEVLHCTPVAQRRSLKVYLGEHPVPLRKESESEHATVFNAAVDGSGLKGKYASLRFIVDDTFCPAEVGNNTDTRKLGIALSWIELF